MKQDPNWKLLKDGQRLHAAHLFQLVDSDRENTATLVTGLGGAGRFLADTTSSDSGTSSRNAKCNQIQLDHTQHIIDVENIRLTTTGGHLVALPPPKKSFAVPVDDGELFLNLYAEDFEHGSGKTVHRWEKQPPQHQRGVCLAYWEPTSAQLRVSPLPYAINSLHAVDELHTELVSAAQTLLDVLLQGSSEILARLHLTGLNQLHLGGLLATLQGATSITADTPLETARGPLTQLAIELEGWFCYLTAAHNDGPFSAVQPDPVVRAIAAKREQAGLAGYVKALRIRPRTGSHLITFMESLCRACVGLKRRALGESDEDPLEPIDTFLPDLFAEGKGYRFNLPIGAPVQVRCEILTSDAPEVFWGAWPSGGSSDLRPLLVDATAVSRFESSLGAVTLEPEHQLVVVVNNGEARLRVYGQR